MFVFWKWTLRGFVGKCMKMSLKGNFQSFSSVNFPSNENLLIGIFLKCSGTLEFFRLALSLGFFFVLYKNGIKFSHGNFDTCEHSKHKYLEPDGINKCIFHIKILIHKLWTFPTNASSPINRNLWFKIPGNSSVADLITLNCRVDVSTWNSTEITSSRQYCSSFKCDFSNSCSGFGGN